MNDDSSLRFIGVVRSPVSERKNMPAFGVPAVVELNAEMAPALLRIEKHSHFWVMAWLMGRPERDVLQVVPRGVDPDTPDSMHGVFAVRSPARPNPIGLTAARLERVEGTRLHFDCLDFLDGTPVLDLKPYFVARDLIFCASNLTIGRPRTRDARRESLLLQAGHFVSESHPDVAVAVRIIEHFELTHGFTPITQIEAPLARPHLVDALIGITKLTFTRGLLLTAGDTVLLNGATRYALPAGRTFDQALAAEASVLE
ncbi:MAG: tRNA (N6-threonylcarbamoyladenosine(37)-N6)-methyltransferase TrmO [Acidobacteria bacterium]|nr:tRNA (N6-threonylcarbamoyladenosine(37)-N6)-methyltransferase TrmO [Acidobacteriota bacterium]